MKLTARLLIVTLLLRLLPLTSLVANEQAFRDLTRPIKIPSLAIPIRPTSDLAGLSRDELIALGFKLKSVKVSTKRVVHFSRKSRPVAVRLPANTDDYANRREGYQRRALKRGLERSATRRNVTFASVPASSRPALEAFMAERSTMPLTTDGSIMAPESGLHRREPTPPRPALDSLMAERAVMPLTNEEPTAAPESGVLPVAPGTHLYYRFFVPTTFFVRQDGSPAGSGGCTGLSDAAYDGSGTGEACAFQHLQDAINAATFGDRIEIKAGHRVGTTDEYQFGEFSLSDKGTPPTNTDSDYITITTTDPSGTPAALSAYATGAETLITTAMAANMPTVVAEGATPLFRIKNGAEYYKIERLNLTNEDNGWNLVAFVQLDDPGPSTLAEVPHHFIFQYLWIHPEEETGVPMDETNIERTAQNALYLYGDYFTVEYNAFQGFAGKVKYGGEAGNNITSSNILSGFLRYSNIRYNLMQAWTYPIFLGGSGMPDWAVTEGTTVASCSNSTTCTLSDATGLNVGDSIAFYITSGDDTWGSSYVATKSGNDITLEFPPCKSYDGNNSCTGIPGNPTPAAGDKVRWNGLQPDQILIERNRFINPPEWYELLGNCSGKGYMELKAGTNITINGNTFSGCTGFTTTVRNQNADFPWVNMSNLTVTNNFFKGSMNMWIAFFSDSSPFAPSTSVLYHNNLYVGLNAPTEHFGGGWLSGNFQGARGITITHNTVGWSPTNHPGLGSAAERNFVAYKEHTMGGVVSSRPTSDDVVIRDNIFPVGRNICYQNGGGTELDMDECWPDAVIDHNVLVNYDGYSTPNINTWWLTLYPSNTLVANYAAVGFTSPNANMDSSANLRLTNASSFHNTASDGTDYGVNFTTWIAGLGFNPFAVTSTPTNIHGRLPIRGRVIFR